MLQTIEELNKVDGPAVMINGVDSPNLLSVDSTEPVPITVDEIVNPGDETIVGVTVTPPVVPAVPADKVEKKEDVAPVVVKKEESLVKKTEEEPIKPKGEEVPLVKGAEKRIGEITKKWRTTERERDFERTKRLEAEAEVKKLSAKIPAEDRPKKEDFDDEEEYFEALTDWKIETKLKVSRDEVATTVKDEDERKAIDQVYSELDTVLERGRGKYKDFNDLVLADDLVLPSEMTELALLSGKPDDVLYYLASHPDESAEIAMLPPAKAAIRIGRIEAMLEVPVPLENKPEDKPDDKVVPPVKKQTNAPEPITPVRTDGVTEKDPSKMSAKEYRAWRESNKE